MIRRGHYMNSTGDGSAQSAECVNLDLPCWQCGYNLRGLPPPGRCPECGEEVATSVRAVRKDVQGRNQRAIVVSGARTIRNAAIIHGISIAMLLFVGLTSQSSIPGIGEILGIVGIVAFVSLVLSTIMICVAGLDLTTPLPDDRSSAPSARAMLQIGYFLIIVAFVLTPLCIAFRAPSVIFVLLMSPPTLIAVSLLRRTRQLCRLIQQPRLVKNASLLLRICACMWPNMIMAGLCDLTITEGPSWVIFVLFVALLISVSIASFWLSYLLSRLLAHAAALWDVAKPTPVHSPTDVVIDTPREVSMETRQ